MEVDKGVPLPGGKAGKYPWQDMSVGDSFLVSEVYDRDLQRKVAAAACKAALRLGVKFSVRKHDGALRVWRVE